MRHEYDPLEIGEMTGPAEDQHDGEWEETSAAGYATGRGKRENRGKIRMARALGSAPTADNPMRATLLHLPHM